MARSPSGAPAPAPPSRCAKVLYYSWRVCSVLFSHLVMISLVVAYCILGAVTFERLEADYERQVKQNISQIRRNTTASIWAMTQRAPLFDHRNWTGDVRAMLQDFESAILLEMKVRGWDGSENTSHLQWTFTGALFYSIIVITTIGYGHIAPKTQAGKVVTILYAIVGIPLMLLCLSNIGDVLASSFRFLYWRACCYMCTRPPRRRRRRPRPARSHSAPSYRRSVRDSTRRRRAVARAHSDTDCRYRDHRDQRDSGYGSGRPRPRPPPPRPARPRSQPPPRTHPPPHHSRSLPLDDFPRVSLPLRDLETALRQLEEHRNEASTWTPRGDYLEMRHRATADEHDPREYPERRRREFDLDSPRSRRDRWDERRFLDWEDPAAEWNGGRVYHSAPPLDAEDHRRRRPYRHSPSISESPSRSRSRSPTPGANWSDVEGALRRRAPHGGSSRAWSGRSETAVTETTLKEEIKPVPIWLCVVLVASYIVAGTFLFKRWESWAYLDAAYFCFITLTTIGFGDFVPAQGGGGSTAAVHSIALCSLYLLFGIALLAMAFNLVQEEVRANVAAVATKLGIIKPQRDPDDLTPDSDTDR